MAALWKNFKFPDLSRRVKNYVVWHETGLSEAVVPWGQLFLTHSFCRKEFCVDRLLYIYRHPFDALKSDWALKDRDLSVEEYIFSKLKYWKEHVESYLAHGVYCISYEDLCSHYDSTLNKIAEKFQLSALSNVYQPVERLVGWSPTPGKRTPQLAYSEKLLEYARQILGDQYLQYHFSLP